MNKLNVKNLTLDPNTGEREWSHAMYDCEYGACMYSFCCPCIMHGRNKNRRVYLARHQYPHPGRYFSSACWEYLCLALLFPGVACFIQCENRGEVRRRYKIKGSECSDCCAAMWCRPCDLVQVSRELALEEETYFDTSPVRQVTLNSIPRALL
ncbi:PLAC8-domain-containing protein [Mycena floridula]|nr:PLAC8-domain-containing protein [Mycena floridula]